jgi:hypothetical protein
MAVPSYFTLDVQEYESLIALAREGTKSTPDRARQLDTFLRSIEKKNGVVRDGLWVQWSEMDQPLPPNTRFPDVWPPQQRRYIELITRLVARVDVDAVLEQHARKPVDVLVTKDPGAQLGWTTLDQFFLTG